MIVGGERAIEGKGAGDEDEEVSDDEVVWKGVALVTADSRGAAALDDWTCVPSTMGKTMDAGNKAIGERDGDDNHEYAEA